MEDAIDKMKAYYAQGPNPWEFHAEWFSERGVSYILPEFCLMARYCLADWSEDLIRGQVDHPRLDHKILLTHKHAAVHVHFAVGDLSKITEVLLADFPLAKFVVYKRHGGPTKIRTRESLLKHIFARHERRLFTTETKKA